MDQDFEEHSFWLNFKSGLIDLIQFLAIVLAFFVVLRFFIAEPHRVSGSSMVPNFHDGDLIITNKLAPKMATLQRGEVIILQNPRNASEVFIKRIIGLPGDQVQISRGQVFINNQPLPEPYLPAGTQTREGQYLSEGEEVVVPDSHYLVMGDNRNGSSDSREWGTIKKEAVVGQAFLRYWPPQSFTFLQVGKKSLY